MSRRARIWLLAAGSVAALVVGAFVAVVLVLQSGWFYDQVRQRIVRVVEDASGGRAEIGRFHFYWREMRVELRGFVLHGNEPASKPPLLRVDSMTVGLKIVSLLKHSVDVQYVDVRAPQVYIAVNPDGSTNVPQPRIRHQERNAAETILDLAIGRFNLENGSFEVEGRGKEPFDARGKNLQAKFAYELAGPRYRGDISAAPLDFQYADTPTLPLTVHAAVELEKDRVQITGAEIATGNTEVRLHGTLQDFNHPRGSFHYEARVAFRDLGAFLREKALESGTIQIGGNGTLEGAKVAVTGNLHAYGLNYRDSSVTLRDVRADGAVTADLSEAVVHGLRFTGYLVTARDAKGREKERLRLDGHVALSRLRHKDVDMRGVEVATLGGTFRGNAEIRDFKTYRAQGEVTGIEAQRVLALVTPEKVPWNGRISGTVEAAGSFKARKSLRASARATVAPHEAGPPVRGNVNVTYDERSGVLDLGTSRLSLPGSQVEFSGAIGKQMRVHLATRDLNELLPVFGPEAKSLPVSLRNGSAAFDGTVTGKLDNPAVRGRLALTNVVYAGRPFRSVQADVQVSASGVAAQNGLAVAQAGGVAAQFQGNLALHNWKPEDTSAVFATATVRSAGIQALASIAQVNAPATGTLDASVHITGTYGDPHIAADVNAYRGTIDGEPFDAATAKIAYTARNIEAAAGRITAGTRQIDFRARYEHAPGILESGRLAFQASSNTMPLEEFRNVVRTRPGVRGTVQVTTSGTIDLAAQKKGNPAVHVVQLQADVTARALQMEGERLGDAHLVAATSGNELTARLESNFANSAIRGEGRWRLDENYNGVATINFSKVDLEHLRQWISPPKTPGRMQLAGSAEADLTINGPLLAPPLWRASLRIPHLELGPAPGTDLAPNAATLILRNSGPIVLAMANNVITVESARLVGRATDLSARGRISLGQPNPLDLRVEGRVDLASVHDFDRDIFASGFVSTNATIRGAFDAPQINGRLQFQNAAMNIADFPNGISDAQGVILFDGSRATIQSLTGESGGGKISLSGFAAYSGEDIIFRLNAVADQVRVRYPEGVSTVANANLDLTGTTARSMVSGTITIVRTGFNVQSDFSSILAKSAEPVRTPSAATGFLGGLNFDIQIETSPDVTFQSSLTQDLQAETNLRLRGTAMNPALLGRVNITQGQVVFFGTKYTINQGSVAFYNPVKIDPILNIDLETKARGIEVTLTVSGPLNKLNLTPRSDPPLQFNEIVALLATGRTPTSDPSLLAAETTSPQSFQQMGASELLGQAIANPVAGRLQRFFGVSRLKIDPSLTGIESNPQARLTLEQQVTQDITFTYITNVTSSNPQVVQVEWAFSRQWSAVALREENGLLGLDFFYKKRFK